MGQVALRPAFFLSTLMNKPRFFPDGIVIPSSTDFLAEVDRYLEEKFKAAGIDGSIITDVAISVSELVNNAIIHGNDSDASKEVDIRFSVLPSELRVVVCDQGKGFDLDQVDDPIDDDNLLREVGRGIFIVRSFVNEVNVTRAPSGGACVEIVKKL
jgi:serine/threonine-protein kinase RsbW